jgi:S-(hydroxymethyl)glutathione dehydrogenase/alcohol dehydrogenase
MRAAVVNAIGAGFDIEDIEIDVPLGREVLVEVKAVGLCHSDLHFAEHDFGNPLPAVLGHELAGVVAAVGPEVSEVLIGQRVVGSLVRWCGTCENCTNDLSYRCTQRHTLVRAAGDAPRLRRADGTAVTAAMGTAAFAEYALIHENQLVVVPEALPFAQAALLGCSTITGAGAVLNTATVSPGDSVAVIGCGGVGLNVLSGALLAQAGTIIAIDTQPAKLELAREFGATHVVDASQGDPVQAVRDITGGGAKHVFEVVGIEATTLQAVRMTATGGTAYLVGLHRPGSTTTLDMMADVLAPQRTIVGVYMGSADIRVDIPRYAELYLDGELNLDSLISRQIKLSEINDGFDEMRRGSAARSVITAWD